MILIIGSIWFWLLVGIVGLFLFAAVENDWPGWGTITLILTFVALAIWGDFNILKMVQTNPLAAAGALGGYFMAGVLWSIGKWYFYVTAIANKLKELRVGYEEYRKEKPLKPWTDSTGFYKDEADYLRSDWRDFVSGSSEYVHGKHIRAEIPKASSHKRQIITWMAYWPWSLVWTLTNDAVKKTYRWLYSRFSAVFEAISKRAFKGIEV